MIKSMPSDPDELSANNSNAEQGKNEEYEDDSSSKSANSQKILYDPLRSFQNNQTNVSPKSHLRQGKIANRNAKRSPKHINDFDYGGQNSEKEEDFFSKRTVDDRGLQTTTQKVKKQGISKKGKPPL